MAKENQNKLLKEAQSLGRTLALTEEDIVIIQRDILDLRIKNNEQLLKALDITEQRTFAQKEEFKLAEKKKKQDQETKDIAENIGRIQKDIQKSQKNIFNNTEDTYNTLRDTVKEQQKQLQTSVANGDVTAAMAKAMNAQLEDQLRLIGALEDVQTKYQQQLDTISSIGGALTKNFGAVGTAIQNGLNKGMDKFITTYAETEDKSKALQAATDAFGSSLTSTLFTVLSIVGIVTILFKTFKDISGQASKLAAETGLSYGQAMKLNNEMRSASTAYGITLATQEDLVAVQKASIAEFGNAAILSGEVAANIAQTGKAFGYGAEQAGLVNNEFMLMGQSGEEAAKSQENLAASALRAGVNVGAVMKDISTNAKNVNKYFGGNVEKLKAAAIEAQKLGLNLQQMGKIADGLLNIETSLASQFEYQAITGKEINLDTARQLALQGDIAGAAKEVVTQFGSLAELQAQGPLAMEAAAKAAGLTTDELTKSMAIQEKIGELSKEEQAAMTNLGLSAADIQGMSDEELKTALAKQQSYDASAKAFTDMKQTLVGAIAPAAEALGAVFQALGPTLKALGVVLGIAFKPLIWAGEAVKFIMDLFNQFPAIMYTILGISTAIWAMENQKLITSFAQTAQYEIGFALLLAQETIEGAILAIKNSQTFAIIKQIAKLAIAAGTQLAQAIGGIFSSFSMIPFGIGIPLAIAAVGGLIAMFSGAFSKTGDLAMSAGGGPIVTNPREGTIFQGTKNDEVAMGPGVIGAAQRTQPVMMSAERQQASTAGTTAAMGDQNRILAQIAEGQKTPAPIQIGTNVIREINTSVQVDKSFNKLGSYNK